MTAVHQSMTLRKILDFVQKQNSIGYEQAMDVPLSIGIHDDYRNFDIGTIYNSHPRTIAPDVNNPGMIRIECHLTNKRMVEVRK